MGGWLHPPDSTEEIETRVWPRSLEEVPEVNPQWAQEALRNAEASFGESGNWGRVPPEKPARRERQQR
jgi:hypothetical protein